MSGSTAALAWEVLPLVVATGVAAGFTNVLAGGGSFVTIPALELLGLPLPVANATNRLALIAQNLSGLRSYARRDIVVPARGWLLAVPASAGAFLGAHLAAELDEGALRQVFGVLFLAMLVVLLLRPKRWLEGAQERRWHPALSWALLFGIGVYGGFIQAGVGVALLAAIVLAEGHDLIVGNAVKVAVVLVYTAVALVEFVGQGLVAWVPGLALACGNAAGAVLGVRFASERGATWVHRILVVIVALTGLRLLLS